MLRGISFSLHLLLMSMVLSIGTVEAQCSELRDVLGIKAFKISSGNEEKLAEKLKSHQKKVAARQKSFYMLSCNLKTQDIFQVANELLLRDYPEIFSFDGKMPIGPIFIPECFIPKKPRIVAPECSKTVLESNPNNKRLQGEVRQTIGDMLEKEVYQTIQDYCRSTNDDVLVIHGLEMQK